MKQCPQCGKRFLSDDIRACDVDGGALQAVIVATAKDRLVNTVVEGRYRMEGVLGDGGMGVVYRAVGVTDRRKYAIKVLRAEYSDEPDLVNRFQLEAESVARIHHENIVRVFEFGSLPDGSRYFVMEFLEGKSLGQLLQSQGKRPGTDRQNPLGDALTIHISRQICAGLDAAHALGIVHRDMKPDNVHLVPGDTPGEYAVKVLDFGIAKVQNAQAARTRTGSVFGTPHYMSPEQAQGERDIDARTDVYAVGVLMYQMCTGRVPFDADNLMGILTAHLYQFPKPFAQVVPVGTVSEGLEAIVFKALAKGRDERYASMAALRDDLDRVARGERPIALEEDDFATNVLSPEELAFANGSSPPNGNSNPTLPAGRISMRPGAPSGNHMLSNPPPAFGDGASVGPAAFQTGLSIPPVTTTSRSQRTPLVVASLALVGVFAFGVAAFMATRRNTAVAAPTPATAPSLSASTSVPNVSAVPALSPTIHIESDPPGATVLRGDVAIGTTPVEVQRPAAGASDSLALDLNGRVRTAIVIAHESAPAMSVPLLEAPHEAEHPHAGHTGAANPAVQQAPANPGVRRDLLDPWGGDQR